MRANTSALIPVLIFATFLRVLRMAVRWDELTLAYAAYAEPLTRSLVEFHPTALIGHWVGLHPPLHGVLHAVTEVFAPIPILWMGMSVLMSLLTVYIVGRHAGWIAALVIATAPVVLLDAAEVNNYPMASLALACVLATARGHWIWFVVSVVFAGWSHLLAGVGAIGVVLWRIWTGSPAERGPIFAWVIIGMLPIVGGVLRLMGLGSTWSQPDVDLLIWLSMIADTIGAANPAAVHSMMHKLVDRYGPERLGCHFHDTRAMGLANVYAALQAGVRQFDASAGGLGGCPFAPGAKGNVATEDVVMLCDSIGYETGLDMPKLLEAVALLSEMIGAPQGGRAHTWLSKQCA